MAILFGSSRNGANGGQTDDLVKHVARRHWDAHADGGSKGGAAARVVEATACNTREAYNRVPIANERKGTMRRPSVALLPCGTNIKRGLRKPRCEQSAS